jgi:hypothetical protein
VACGCNAACGANCECGCHQGFTAPEAGAAASARLSAMWDRARDLRVRLGLRPYKVSIVRARASGMRQRGDGPTEITGKWTILPTPKVSDLTSLTEVLAAEQLRESGGVSVSEISLRYSENTLLGRGDNGRPLAGGEAVYWEIQYLDPSGRPAMRRRFTPSSAPAMHPERAEWVVNLTRVNWEG